MLSGAEVAARALRLRIRPIEVQGAADLDGAFAEMRRSRVGALAVLPGTFLSLQRRRLAELAIKHRLPVLYISMREIIEGGGLMSYGASTADLARRMAAYVDKILKGARSGDLPVEQPTKLDLVINLKSARAIGLTFPPSLLARADQVVE